MKNKIKKILDRLDYDEWEVDLYKVPITWCELYDIRDYITNLQERNNNLKEDFKRHIDRINELTERNDKAIEYIKEWQSFPHTNCTTHNELKNLLNILQGSDKE